MAETRKVLGQANPGAATLVDLYIVPAVTQAVVSTLMIANRSAVATTFRVAVAVAGVADDPKQYIAYDVEIEGNGIVPVTIGATLGAADVVRVFATLATLSFNLFGAELT